MQHNYFKFIHKNTNYTTLVLGGKCIVNINLYKYLQYFVVISTLKQKTTARVLQRFPGKYLRHFGLDSQYDANTKITVI